MTLWMVRAGRYGERESVALDENVVTIGWKELPDLSSIKTKEQLKELYWKYYPESKKMKAANHIGQLWRFIHDIKIGDLVALPLKTQSAITFGKITGDYDHKKLGEKVLHIRRVKWLKTMPRSAFDQDLLYSFGAFMTVCQIHRNNAEIRVKAVLAEKKPIEIEGIGEEIIEVEEYARDQIRKYIDKKFIGHGLARLVNAILNTQGYVTKESPPGPDGGIDILASAGSLGFDSPRICVQVKSSSSPIDVRIVRELRGVMPKVKAEQGLLVSWGGFNTNALKEAKDDFFTIRLWDSDKLIESIFKYYDKFDDELKAELPLKRIWALVLEEE